MSDQTFPAELRIRSREDFNRVYQRSVYAADDILVALACENGLSQARLGLSVSRKVGNAVVRNRWKRRMREAFRLQKEKLPPGVDFVLRPKKGAKPKFAAIYKSLPQVAQRAARRLGSRGVKS